MEKFNDIERYLLNKMSADERSDFEKKMESDAELKQEKDKMAELILGVESLGLKNKLKGRVIGEEVTKTSSEKKSTKIISFSKIAVAASVAVFLICGWWFFQPDLSSSDEQFANVFITDPGLPTRMSETDHYNFYDAMVEYKMENYDKALEIWTNNKINIGQDTLDYYIGMAYLNQKNYDKAEALLVNIDPSSSFSSKAKWYRLKILIEKNDFEEAKALIKEIPSTFHPQYNEVKNYLESK